MPLKGNSKLNQYTSEIINKFKSDKNQTYKELATEYECSQWSIIELLKRNNLYKRRAKSRIILTKSQVERIIKLYNKGIEQKEIAKLTKTTVAVVWRTLKKYNIWKNKHIIYKQMIKDLNNDLSFENIEKICIKYNRPYDTFVGKLRKLKLIPPAPEYLYSVNHDFFEDIDTEEKAYMLGFIIGDGNVSSTHNRLAIIIKSIDREILEKFKQATGFAGRVIDNFNDNRGSEMSILGIGSKKIKSDLAKYGVIPAKTGKLKWHLIENNVKSSMMPHLLRGLLDSDGSWAGKRICFKFGGQGRTFIKDMFNYMKNNTGCIGGNVYRSKKANNFYNINFGGRSNIRILNKYFYDGATIFLQRKFDKVNNYLKESEPKVYRSLQLKSYEALKKLDLLNEKEIQAFTLSNGK